MDKANCALFEFANLIVSYVPLCDVIDLKQFSMYPDRLSCAQSGPWAFGIRVTKAEIWASGYRYSNCMKSVQISPLEI